jgi:hypothetical protein
MTGRLRVATLNLWGQRGDWAARRRVLAAGFARLNADLAVTPRASESSVTTLVIQVDAPPPFGPVLFANHFPNRQLPFERERELQAVAAARSLEAAIAGRHRHVVIAGDLDADPEAASMRFWTGRQSLADFSVCYRDGQ